MSIVSPFASICEGCIQLNQTRSPAKASPPPLRCLVQSASMLVSPARDISRRLPLTHASIFALSSTCSSCSRVRAIYATLSWSSPRVSNSTAKIFHITESRSENCDDGIIFPHKSRNLASHLGHEHIRGKTLAIERIRLITQQMSHDRSPVHDVARSWQQHYTTNNTPVST